MSNNNDVIRLVEDSITELLQNFVNNPLRFTSEHGWHSLFAHLLWCKSGCFSQKTTETQIKIDWVQNEYGTGSPLGRSKCQHWDFAIFDRSVNQENIPIAIVEFGLKSQVEHVYFYTGHGTDHFKLSQKWKTPHYIDDLDRLYRSVSPGVGSNPKMYIVELFKTKNGVNKTKAVPWQRRLLIDNEKNPSLLMTKADWIKETAERQKFLAETWDDYQPDNNHIFHLTQDDIQKRINEVSLFIGIYTNTISGAFVLKHDEQTFRSLQFEKENT